jgi:peptidoglycan/xylan/chitin deacetylase (PgdA/CDA1 family)
VLKEFGLKAHFFILVGRVGTEGYMNWDQVKELHRAGMTIGSHGMSHCFLTELNDAELACELTDSKKLLEEVLGTAVDSLSIPRGFYNARVLEKAAQAGYKTVFASDNRIAIKADWDFEHFKYVLRKGYSFGERLQRFVLAAAKVILGPKGYERVRTQLLGKH